MLNVMLASHGFFRGGYYGGNIGNLLAYWEQVGFFSFVLPFLLIFALVYGILTKTKIFKDSKGVNGIIALTVGLLSLQFDFVPVFFSEIFPRVGVGLSVILALFILLGLFLDPDSNVVKYSFLAVGVIIFYIVIVQTAQYVGWGYGFWLTEWPTVLTIIGFLVALGIVFKGGGGNKKKHRVYQPYQVEED